MGLPGGEVKGGGNLIALQTDDVYCMIVEYT